MPWRHCGLAWDSPSPNHSGPCPGISNRVLRHASAHKPGACERCQTPTTGGLQVRAVRMAGHTGVEGGLVSLQMRDYELSAKA